MAENETKEQGVRGVPAWARPLALAAILGLYVAHCIAVDRVTDDCFISFRYARNFAEGHGLVYNPGERVEGYTNFLWTLLLGVTQWLWPSADLLRLAQALSVAFGAAVILLVARAARRYGASFGVELVAAASVALNGGFAAWSTGALESNLFILLIFGACLAELHGRWHAPLLFALATMTRLDGIVFVGGLLLWRTHRSWRARRRLVEPATLAWIGLFLLVFGPYFAWRWSYYGWLFPNTYYAKVGEGRQQWYRGLHYVTDYLRDFGWWLPLLPLPLLLRRWREGWVGLLVVEVVAGTLFVIYVGGESLGFARFLVPLVPFIAVLVALGVPEWGAWLGPRVPWLRGTAGRVCAGMIYAVTLGAGAWRSLHVFVPGVPAYHDPQTGLDFPSEEGRHPYLWFTNYFVDRLSVAARWLDAHAPEGALIASTPAGAIGYGMHHRVLDMLGLNDEHIAHTPVPNMGTGRAGHEKGDGRYVLECRPDYLLLGNVAVFDHPLDDDEMQDKLVLRSEHEIWELPEFRRDYELVHVALAPSGLFQWFSFYRRKGVAER